MTVYFFCFLVKCFTFRLKKLLRCLFTILSNSLIFKNIPELSTFKYLVCSICENSFFLRFMTILSRNLIEIYTIPFLFSLSCICFLPDNINIPSNTAHSCNQVFETHFNNFNSWRTKKEVFSYSNNFYLNSRFFFCFHSQKFVLLFSMVTDINLVYTLQLYDAIYTISSTSLITPNDSSSFSFPC